MGLHQIQPNWAPNKYRLTGLQQILPNFYHLYSVLKFTFIYDYSSNLEPIRCNINTAIIMPAVVRSN